VLRDGCASAASAVQTLTLFEPLPIAILGDTGDEDAFNEIATFVENYRRSTRPETNGPPEP
jgi:hypothetical protein